MKRRPTAQKRSHKEVWNVVDAYIAETLVCQDAALEAALKANAAAKLPQIDVAPNQGKLLQVLALTRGARRILEIGTLGGYSTIWMARALPKGGRLVTLEREPRHAEVARENLEHAGMAKIVEIRMGPALDSLKQLYKERAMPFDMIFIDADKANIPAYLDWAMKLAKVGTLIVTDNVVRDGAIVDAANPDPDVRGVRAMFDQLAKEPRLVATALQTVGTKGYDGIALAVVVKK